LLVHKATTRRVDQDGIRLHLLEFAHHHEVPRLIRQGQVQAHDVRLPEKNQPDEETLNVVQPDISVICDPDKIDDKGCKGAPELIIEIVSPATVKKDLKYKLQLYENSFLG
jgi:Uma2 family endonuclease